MTDEQRADLYAAGLQRLIQFETVSVMGKPDPEKFRRFHGLLRETFPKLFATVEAEDFDGSLLMRWPGKTRENPLLLMNHHDVVAASGNWTHAPFSGDIADGKLWGRGTLDTKGPLFAMLRAAEELTEEGFTPDRDVWFESACNEETHGSGANAISASLEQRGIRFGMVLDEGGMIVENPIGGIRGTFAMVGVGEKGCADLKFIARSNGGHASAPGKNTPLVRLGRFMAEADKGKCFSSELSPTVTEMFRRLSGGAEGAYKFLLRNASALKPLLSAVIPAVSATAGAMLKTTLAFTMAGGSEGTNVLPMEAWVVGNMRSSHHQGQQDSIEKITALAKKYGVETEVTDPGFPSPVTDFRSDGFRLAEDAVRAVFPGVETVPYIMTAASDSRYFSRVSDCCIRFAPFTITGQQLESIHGIDENVDVKALAPAVDYYKTIIRGVRGDRKES